ncbi:P-loop containing nucleoside triphosphate hydrolase protein, partial [Phaeosphaeriaceae sp. PMI808]
GIWYETAKQLSRSWESVVLDEERKIALAEDIARFLQPSRRAYYAGKGVAWRRGYLLHGPPGTGKTSLILAIAAVFKLNVYILPVTPVTDESLPMYLRNMRSPSVLLFEDIDSAGFIEKKEEDASDQDQHQVKGLSRSGFINAIDGVRSRDGYILIMTTNHLEKLDDAMIRTGRIDYRLEVPLASKTNARQFFVRW